MNTRKLRKFLLTLSCALLLVSLSVGVTLAYLTDSESVTNTFSVGQVGLSLDEADVDNSTEGENDRDHANGYNLLPGQQYAKDPIVHIDAKSEPCWVFVKVENGLSAIEDKASYAAGKTGTIAEQIVANGWTKLDNVDNVYYMKHETKLDSVKDYTVFTNFKLKGEGLLTGTKPANYTGNDLFLGDYSTATIKVTAYAIQLAGFEDNQSGAWTEVSKLDK